MARPCPSFGGRVRQLPMRVNLRSRKAGLRQRDLLAIPQNRWIPGSLFRGTRIQRQSLVKVRQ